MRAEILREGAKAARDEWAGEVSGPFKNAARIHLAVADWLDAEATRMDELADFDRAYGDTPDEAILAARANDARHALTVARAYLGSES